MSPGFGTPSVALATTPTVISTFFSHVINTRRRRSKARQSLKDGGPGGGPEDQLSYEEGIKVVRRFLEFASTHGVEEVQAFTAMRVPVPHWVRREVVTIPQDVIDQAAGILSKHLGSYWPSVTDGDGRKMVGGEKWWQIRGKSLEGEWIEMQKDYVRRTALAAHAALAADGKAKSSSERSRYDPRRGATMSSVRDGSGANVAGERVILYIHGGAFFFSSLDTHRYQIQRHARKAGARAFAPSYRLAPQYPFPCGLLDALASYLFLLHPPPGAHAPILPSSIIFMGDSAGGGMCISLLILIREMGLPMPAGASLVSPWVDLTHSMPSISGPDEGDYIPSSGFHYKPSAAWPPLPGDGITITMPDGSEQHFDEQVQMYCPNNLLTHPLVSPVNAGSLGGLCPLFIMAGGGELLRDEIIYLAHKAADPITYRPSDLLLEQYPDQAGMIKKYKPTKVHLQVFEGCCHVAPTLSWTRGAKYMYRAAANFNIWAYTAAAKALDMHVHHVHHKHHTKHSSVSSTSSGPSPITPNSAPAFTSEPGSMVDTPATSTSAVDLSKPLINPAAAVAANREEVCQADVESEASSDSDEGSSVANEALDPVPPTGVVSVRGAEPTFGEGSIVAERVSMHGRIRPFEPVAEVPALDPALRERIGQIHGDGAIQKWLAKRAQWDAKFASALAKWRDVRRADRARAEKTGYLTRDLDGERERPPLCSLAGWHDQALARDVGRSVDETSTKTSGAVTLWMKMSSKADKEHAGGDSVEDIKKNVQQDVAEEVRAGQAGEAAAPAAPAPGV
ncbi:hypothetical protein Q5752_001258 [Cryptotrichosporon argae]